MFIFLFCQVILYIFGLSASTLLQQNVIALIEGSLTKTSAWALSSVTGIPLIRLNGNNKPYDQHEHAVQMSAGYKYYAHATLDILKTLGLKKIALVFEGKSL